MVKHDISNRNAVRKRPGFLRRVALFVWIAVSIFTSVYKSAVLAVEIPVPGRKVTEVKQESNMAELPSSGEIEKRIEQIKDSIKTAKAAETELKYQQMGVTLTDLQERTAKLTATSTTYERLLTAMKKKGPLEDEETRLQTQIVKDIDQKPLYSLSAYDGLLDELATLEQQRETMALALKLAKGALEEAMLKLEKARKEWRNIKDKLDETPDKSQTSRLTWDLESAYLERNFEEAIGYLEKVNIENLSRQLQISTLYADLSRREISWARDHLYYDESDLAKQLEALQLRIEEFEKRIKNFTEEQERTERNLLITSGQSKIEPGVKSDLTNEEALKERETWRKTYQEVREQTEDMIRLLGYQEQFWKTRYALVKGGTSHNEAVNQKKEIETYTEGLRRLLSLQQSYQNSILSQISALERKLSEENLDPTIESHLRNRLKASQKLIEGRLEYISALLATENMARRTLDEIAQSKMRISLKEKLTDLMDSVQDIWNFEIWVIDNRPVTVRKLIIAFIILIIGILIARYVLRALGRRLFSYAHIKESTASGVQKIFLYLAYLLVLIFALRMVNIPLEAFAFLGGAIAIGVGFGAQNLINNFISGFIIMGERPIKIGNIVEVEGVLGQVEEIGARSTRIRTGENIHILVPNSSFLEKNITNWTLSDQQIRAHVAVGVRYGSPVREVERLLLEAVRGEAKVLKAPEPFIIFDDFGDNALVFQVHFWISIKRIIDRRLIESSIRFTIDDVFQQAGIVIAFPQRDVHLDSLSPLEFRFVEKKDE